MSNDIGYVIVYSRELNENLLNNLISDKKPFKITEVHNISGVVELVEKAIEKKGYSCRVYTEYRSTAIATGLIPTGITNLTGIVSAIGIGVHNLCTYNPDFEIGKNKFNETVTVVYKKETHGGFN